MSWITLKNGIKCRMLSHCLIASVYTSDRLGLILHMQIQTTTHSNITQDGEAKLLCCKG